MPWILNLPSFSAWSVAMAAEDKKRVLLLLAWDILEEVVDCRDAAALLEEDMNIRCIISTLRCGSVTSTSRGRTRGSEPNRIPL